jgi:hypothetical protein
MAEISTRVCHRWLSGEKGYRVAGDRNQSASGHRIG